MAGFEPASVDHDQFRYRKSVTLYPLFHLAHVKYT